MPPFSVNQQSVKSLAKSLRSRFGEEIRHKAMIGIICSALSWKADVLMHILKGHAEAGRIPDPTIPLPDSFQRDLAKGLTSAYGRPVLEAQVAECLSGDASSQPVPRPEPIFGTVARALVAKGWSVFPQDIATRRPGNVDGVMIDLTRRPDVSRALPAPDTIDRWVEECGALNAGVSFGPASGNAVAIDIDTDDDDLSFEALDLVKKHLGTTDLVRFQSMGKVLLIFRGDGVTPIRSRRYMVPHPQVASPSVLSIEVLSIGWTTLIGKHHKTGIYYKWPRKSPLEVSPTECPMITQGQIDRLAEALDTLPVKPVDDDE